jgi:hypothetical protein
MAGAVIVGAVNCPGGDEESRSLRVSFGLAKCSRCAQMVEAWEEHCDDYANGRVVYVKRHWRPATDLLQEWIAAVQDWEEGT